MEKAVNKRFKFIGLVIFVIFALGGQILYLSFRDSNIEQKLALTKITSLNSFAFYTQTPYLRHSFGHGLNEVFMYHPTFLESDTGSFVNSGYAKRFKEK